MSVIVAIRDNDKILVGADSQATMANGISCTLKNQMKIWKPSDDINIVMGQAGDLRDVNILSITEGWIDELTKMKNEVNFKYIVKNVVPKLFKELDQYKRIQYSDGIQYMQSGMIFAYKNMAYQIDNDGAVLELNDILAIGSGRRICYGAWQALKYLDIPLNEKLAIVIRAACEMEIYVSSPIVIMNTKDNEIIKLP